MQRVVIKIIKRSQDFFEKYDKMTSISNIISSPNAKYERIIESSKDKEILCVIVDRANNNVEQKYLFDYFKSGFKLSCFISLDFSNSIKNPTLIDTKENYIGLLKNISNIESYIQNHIYYSYGFGAKIFGFSKEELIGRPLDYIYSRYEGHLLIFPVTIDGQQQLEKMKISIKNFYMNLFL